MDLIRFPSVSNSSNRAISDFLSRELVQLGFELEVLTYMRDGVEKVCVVGRRGSGNGGFAYVGHTDVVPADGWEGPGGNPFEPVVEQGRLYGRGSCDMKGSIACFITAIRGLDRRHQSPIYVILTSDEETGQQGAATVAARSSIFRDMVQGRCVAIVGEPTERQTIYAHKGTCLVEVVSHGRAGHSGGTAGINANLAMIPFLARMLELHHDSLRNTHLLDSRFDPPTISMNIGVNDFTTAVNITPARSICTIFLRPMPGQDVEPLLAQIRSAADQQGLSMSISRREPPFQVDPQSPFVQETIRRTGTERPGTVNFGTDACRLNELERIVLLGPGSIRQAHMADEYITFQELQWGTEAYQDLVRYWCQIGGGVE